MLWNRKYFKLFGFGAPIVCIPENEARPIDARETHGSEIETSQSFSEMLGTDRKWSMANQKTVYLGNCT